MRNALTYLLWPFVTGAATYGTYLGLAAGYPVPVVFFAVGAGMLACVLAFTSGRIRGVSASDSAPPVRLGARGRL